VARNTAPIIAVLQDWLPPSGLVLEVASGSGEHALACARAFPQLQWQPSDLDPLALASAGAWRADGPANLLPPVALDVRAPDWPVESAAAVVAVNMVHISPWESSLGLLEGARRLLRPGGVLILYGPWLVEGEPIAPSNLAFDADLQRRDPAWGLREVGAFAREAAPRGLILEEQRAMPANNRMLLFRRG
jgi:SAM-dependent methyltransferase